MNNPASAQPKVIRKSGFFGVITEKLNVLSDDDRTQIATVVRYISLIRPLSCRDAGSVGAVRIHGRHSKPCNFLT